MNATQLPFLVEGLILSVAIALGLFLGRKARPYGKVKLGFHLFFFLWFTMGYYYVAQVLFSGKPWTAICGAVIVMGLALLVQLSSGAVMLARKQRVSWLPWVHGGSATLLLVADAVAFFLAGNP